MTTKSVYAHNSNICLGIFEMVFMKIDTFKIIVSMKRDHENIFRFVSILS